MLILALLCVSVAGFEKRERKSNYGASFSAVDSYKTKETLLIIYLSCFSTIYSTHTHPSLVPCLHINGFVISLVMAPYAIN